MPFLIMVAAFTLTFYWLLLRRLQAEILEREGDARWIRELVRRAARVSEFFQMGGHGAYVWSAYGITLVVLVLNAWLARVKDSQRSARARARHAGEVPRKQPTVRRLQKSRTQRKLFMVVVLAGVAVAGFLTYRALQENLLYFFSPTQVAAGEAPTGTFRLGGMVVEGSLKRETGSLNVSFVVTRQRTRCPVQVHRVLPDLFREGAGRRRAAG